MSKINFKEIIQNQKEVKETNSILVIEPLLDISFYGREALINKQICKKGKVYQYKNITFASKFIDKNTCRISYFDGDKGAGYEDISTKELCKLLNINVPYELLGQATSTIVNARREENVIFIDFKSGTRKKIELQGHKLEKKNIIDKNIAELEQIGYSTTKLKTIIKTIVPEIFEKNPIQFDNIEELEKFCELYIKFGFTSTGGITGEGINFLKTLKNNTLNITTQAGHRYYGTWTQFDINLTVPIKTKQVLQKLEPLIEYQNKLNKRMAGYGAGLAAHIKSTGGHRGNPVWMD